jgi:endonuclease YncB( thermonuclease family)
MRRLTAWCAAAAFVTMVAGACGGDASALAQTDHNMAKLKAAAIDLRLAASAGDTADGTKPVGFRLAGPFEFSQRHDLAVFDVTYTRLLGDRSQTTEVRSTGEAAFVTAGGKAYRVARGDLAPLRVSKDAGNGFGDLGISGWVISPKTRAGTKVDGQATEVITGEVDAPDLLSDLARMAGPLGGDNQLQPLGKKAAERLRRFVRASTITVVTGAKDRQLRSLHAVVNFGTSAPVELRKTLGRYAQARIDVRLTMKKQNSALRVAPPQTYVTL